MDDLNQYEQYRIEEICRICLVKNNEMVIIGESGIENLLTSASIQLLEEEKSHFLCVNCLGKLNEWYDFNQLIIKSFRIGHWLIEQSKKENNLKEYSIKQEMCFINSPFQNNGDPVSISSLFSNDIKYINEVDTVLNIDKTYLDCINNTENPRSCEISECEFDSNAENDKDVIDNKKLGDFSHKQCNKRLTCEENIVDEDNCKQAYFDCAKCGKQFKRAQTLSDHMKRHYNSRNFACSVCGKTFYKQFNVNEHMRMHTGERPFKCEVCFRTFTRALLLRNHIKKIHTNDKKFICGICEKSFVDGYQLKIHMRTHTGEKPYQCSECQNTFALQGQLNSHIKYKHTKQKDFICNVCARAFTAKHSLEEHLRTHTGKKKEPKHECSFCGKKCITTTHLKIHIKSQHTGERPFPCQFCYKNFVTKSTLDCHVRTHTGEKTFICGECGKAFSANSTLRIHLRIHTGERPYKCNVCCKSFAQVSTLNTHVKIHK